MEREIRKTRSVCPVCLRNLPARLLMDGSGRVVMEKSCPEHGGSRVTVWQGLMDWDAWLLGVRPLGEGLGLGCPGNCGICAEHEIGTCCALLEVTARCELRCRFCFARGGESDAEPTLDALKESVRDIVSQCGSPLLQLSGGEPTMRGDLEELVRYAKEAGCSYVQLNTNGIRLAAEPGFAGRLAAAGLDIVFLQFDGTRDEIYETLRGRPLFETKKEAVRACAEAGIGVTLVPTVVEGVNDGDLGEIVSFAASMSPAVRGVHFQPVSYFGRHPGLPDGGERYTLDRLMADISAQSGIPKDCFMPSRCDHPLCGFHADFLPDGSGGLRPLSSITLSSRRRGCADDNREYVARHWRRAPDEPRPEGAAGREESGETDFDTFLYRLRHERLSLSAMAFQDASNLNIERLHSCSLHVYDKGLIKPFCARYLTPVSGG